MIVGYFCNQVLLKTDEPNGIKQGKKEYDYTKSNRLQENPRKHHGLHGCSHERLRQRLQLPMQTNQCHQCEQTPDFGWNVRLQLYMRLQLQCTSPSKSFFRLSQKD
jgi:hypothetical protein